MTGLILKIKNISYLAFSLFFVCIFQRRASKSSNFGSAKSIVQQGVQTSSTTAVVSENSFRCNECHTINEYSPTDVKDIIKQCSNKNCSYYTCTLNRCFMLYNRARNASNHQNLVHRKHADVNKCHFCKASKIRDGTNKIAQCSNCKIFWCVHGNCTYEFINEADASLHRVDHW